MMMKTNNMAIGFIRCGNTRRVSMNAIQDISWSNSPDNDGDYNVYIRWINGGGENFYLKQQEWEDFIQEVNLYCPQLSY